MKRRLNTSLAHLEQEPRRACELRLLLRDTLASPALGKHVLVHVHSHSLASMLPDTARHLAHAVPPTADRRPSSRDSEATLYPPSTASSMTLSDEYAPSQGSSKGSSRGSHARRGQTTVSPLLRCARLLRHSCHIRPHCKTSANLSLPCSPNSSLARSRSQVTISPMRFASDYC